MAKLKRKLKKTRIGQGKEIVPWVERLNYFNDYFRPEGYKLRSKLIDINDSTIMMLGEVIDPEGVVVADGFGSKRINEPFAVQKCQSSALNRALFILGIVDSGEDTIMDEHEAKELQEVKAVEINQVFDNMVAHIEVDYSVVEAKIPAYKNQLTSDQVSQLKKLINKKKSEKATKLASK